MQLIKTKVCTKCKKSLPTTNEYFANRKSSKDGLEECCKECKKIRAEKYRKENPEKVKETSKKYIEGNKEKLKIRGEKYRKENPNKSKEYYENNKENFKKHNNEYYKNNKDFIQKQNKKWREENPGKVKECQKQWLNLNRDRHNISGQRYRAAKRKLPNNLTEKQWNVIKSKFDNKCAYCGQVLPLEQEHFIPLSKGGEYTLNNIIPSCKSCNCSKCNMDFFKWYPKQSFYSKQREKTILKHLKYKKSTQQLRII